MLEVKFDDQIGEYYLTDGVKRFNCEIEETVGYFINEQKAVNLLFQDKEQFEIALGDFDNLLDRVRSIEMPSYINWGGINISVEVFAEENEWWGRFEVTFYLESWEHVFTVDQYMTEFARIRGNEDLEVTFEGEPTAWESVVLYADSNNPLKLVEDTFGIILDFHNEAINRLITKTENTGLNLRFDFPEDIKTICEQYLLYFATFLKDLKINVT